jgi:benzoyl-CoA reductase/2-hydroxyglutaryl-CoA dehydratase subunit BcrC/BadD/HgdB
MPKEEYNRHLKELIDELRTEEGVDGYKARLMVVGPAIEDPEFFEVIEDSGGLIVTDSTCYGTRLFQDKVDESGDDPLAALARYYLISRPGCPHSVGQSKRSDYVRRIAQEYAVDGIIGARLKFCENWGMEHHMLDDAMKEDDIPCLILEKEYQLGGVGQVRTRVQAFLEMIEGRQS